MVIFINRLCLRGKHDACHSNSCGCSCGHEKRSQKLGQKYGTTRKR